MDNKQLLLLKHVLGEHYLPLMKSIVKQATHSVVDITELHDSLKIVPKAIMTFIMQATQDMENDGAKEVKIPWEENSMMLINKASDDVYRGHFTRDGKVVHEFELCSIPQLCAHLLSFSEMYDEVPEEEAAPPPSDDVKEHLKALDGKINALMMMIASQSSVQKSEALNKGLKHVAAAGAMALGMMGQPAHATYEHVDKYLNSMKGKVPGVQVQTTKSPGVSNGKLSVGKFNINTQAVLGGHGIGKHSVTLHGPDQSTWDDKDNQDYQNAKYIHQHLTEVMPKLMDMTTPVKDLGKAESDRNEQVKRLGKSLKKAGIMPKPPQPPKPGTNVGGNNGITKEGIHSDKTTATDAPGHELHTQVKNPWTAKFNAGAKNSTQPKQPKTPSAPATASAMPKLAQSEKEMTFSKSELEGKCVDCGRPLPHCPCFRALSKPLIKSSIGDRVTLKFDSDWDTESTEALYKSITTAKRK